MMPALGRCPLVFPFLATAALLASCATEDVHPPFDDTKYIALSPAATETESAPLVLSLAADAGTWDEEQRLAGSSTPLYTARVDGRWLMIGTDGDPYPVQIFPGGVGYWTLGWTSPGAHVVELVDASGHVALDTTLDLRADQTNHLVVFGPRDALEHQFVANKFDIPAGMLRYTVLNLLRSGETVDVIQCLDPNDDASCTTLAGPLAYGQVAQGLSALSGAGDASTTAYRVTPAPAPLRWQFPVTRDLMSASLPYPVWKSMPGLPEGGPQIYLGAPTILEASGGGVSLF